MAVTAVIAWPPSIVIVLMSAWMPAPPPESDPAITRMRAGLAFIAALRAPCGSEIIHAHGTWFRVQLRTKGSRRALHSLANVVDQAFDQLWIVAFGHDADQRLGARLADDEPAATLQFGLGCGDPPEDAVGLQRRSPPLKRTFFSSCGTGSKRWSTSLAACSESTSAASTWSAATSPSPVVE